MCRREVVSLSVSVAADESAFQIRLHLFSFILGRLQNAYEEDRNVGIRAKASMRARADKTQRVNAVRCDDINSQTETHARTLIEEVLDVSSHTHAHKHYTHTHRHTYTHLPVQ